jgi:CBS domain containing-hemolysin-like protein
VILALLGIVLTLVLLTALFSGSETGIYSLPRLRLDARARRGSRAARWLRALLANETRLLITLLVGLNLTLELCSHGIENVLGEQSKLPGWARELVITAFLTPTLFVLGDLLPKDAFRRRPYLFLRLAAPFLWGARVLLAPLVWPLECMSRFLERTLGVGDQDFSRALGREEVVNVLEEGSKAGAIAQEARDLAQNVLVLRHTAVADVMTPWDQVLRLDLERAPAERRAVLAGAEFTRIPVTRADGAGGRVVGYLHQLEALVDGESLESHVRELPELAPDVSVERALSRLRASGQRIALVGTAERPVGLVTVMDLVSAISMGARSLGRARRSAPDPLAATPPRG